MKNSRLFHITTVAAISIVLAGCGGAGSVLRDKANEQAAQQTEARQEQSDSTSSSDVDSSSEKVTGDKSASSTAYTEPAKASAYHYELKEAGSFAGDRSSLDFQQDGALRIDGDSAYLVGPNGESLHGTQSISAIDYLGDGIFVVRADKGNEVN